MPDTITQPKIKNRIMETGQKVERIGSPKDYTTGRTGVVVENNSGERVRVHWTHEKGGSKLPGNGVRTFVNIKFLKAIND